MVASNMESTLTVDAPDAAKDTAFSPREIEQYRTEGYVVVPNLFGREELERTYACIRELTHTALASSDHSKIMELEPEAVDGERVPRRIYDPFEQHEAFRALATDAKILDRIQTLIGPDIGIQHSKLNMKPAKVGSVVDWHQDLTYFPHTNSDLITTLVYLDDATEENGCLQVLPRHQHHFFNHALPDGTFAGMITEDLSDNRYGRPQALPAPAGSVIFMHCILPHSSLPNRSPKPRRTLIFEYRAADAFPIYFADSVVQYEAKAHLLRGKPATTARFGGPAPVIPKLKSSMKSLYEMQRAAKNSTR
jgi:phytanoyl-CoA hydroxylase